MGMSDVAANLAKTRTPLEEISLEMSKVGSSACVMLSVAVLRCLLESQGPTSRGAQTLRKTMLEKKVKESEEVLLACLLDPQYKECPCHQEH